MRRLAVHAGIVAALAAAVAVAGSAGAPGPAEAAQAGSPYKRYLDALFVLRHPKGLERFAQRVSDPGSRRYRDYASVEELVTRFGAGPKTRKAAASWLSSRGIAAKLDRTGTFMVARVPARRAGRVLGAAGAAAAAAGGEPARAPVPGGLRGSVAAIELLGTEPVVQPQAAPHQVHGEDLPADHGSLAARTGTAEGCPEGANAGDPPPYQAFAPNQYLEAYGHGALHGKGIRGKGVRAAVVEIDGFLRSDIETFGACFGFRVPPTPVFLIGIKKPLAPGGETTLDLELLSATAPGLRSIDVYQGKNATGQLLQTIAGALGPKGRHPDVISISIGGCEAALMGQVAQTVAMNHVFAVAAGAGISVFVASGDQGSSSCVDRPNPPLPLLSVSSPASSPWVTAVGGTNMTLAPDNKLLGQVTWNDVPVLAAGGGGGASILFRRPFYQHGRRDNQASYNRIVPDLAALADVIPGYSIFCTAAECGSADHPPGWVPIGGTSAATPLTAGGVALADQLARKAGQPNLGLINPLLYDVGRGRRPGRFLFDVFTGNNDLGTMLPPSAGGGSSLGCCSAGPGFDHATGWGSLRVNRFAKRALKAAGG